MKYFTIVTMLFILSCAQRDKEKQNDIDSLKWEKNHSIKVMPTYDTIYYDTLAQLILSFKIKNQHVSIIGNYRKDDSLSFIDPLYYSSMSIMLNDSMVKARNSYNFIWGEYFGVFDSVMLINNKKGKFAILNGRPLFCNGFYCSNISALIIKLNNPKAYQIINTEFCDDHELSAFIYRNNNPSDSTLQIPIYADECSAKNKKMKIINIPY